MAVRETTPPHYIVFGYKELGILAAILLLIVVAISGVTKWAISRTFAPLQEDRRAFSKGVDAGFAENRSELRGETGEIRGEITNLRGELTAMRNELTAMRNELTDLRKDISDLSNRVTRIETILEQQRRGTTAPDTP